MTLSGEVKLPQHSPLSELELRVWALGAHSGPEQAVQLCLEIQGAVRMDTLQSSLHRLGLTHPVLLTRFELVDGVRLRHAGTRAAIALPVIDLSHRTGEDLLAEAYKRLQVWMRERFNLSGDALIRARLVRLAPGRHWLHLMAPLVICDEDSMRILAQELVSVYRTMTQGGELPPVAAPSSSGQGFLHGSSCRTFAERTEYWTSQLDLAALQKQFAGGVDDLRKPTRWEAMHKAIPVPVVEQLRVVCSRWGVSLGDLTLAAFAAVSARRSHQTEIFLSTSLAIPGRAAMTDPIGSVADALPLRLKIESSDSLRELSLQARMACESALSNAPAPFDVVVDWMNRVGFHDALSKPGQRSFDPLTAALFSFREHEPFDGRVDEVRFSIVEDVPRFTRFELECRAVESEQAFTISAVYKPGVYDKGSIEALLNSYCNALSTVAAGADPLAESLDVGQETASNSAPDAGSFDAHSQAEREGIERELVEIWAELLPGRVVGLHESFFALGGDSILSVMLATKARRRGLIISPRQVFSHQTISALAAVTTREHAAPKSPDLTPEVEGVPLTPIQQWWFEHQQPDLSAFSQSVRLEAQAGVEGKNVVAAVRALYSHHDALRLRFSRHDGQWRQNVASATEPDCAFIDLSGLEPEQQEAVIMSTARRLQSTLNIESGPLINAAWFDRGTQRPGELFVTIHHLAVDGVSWRILIEDLEAACRAMMKGESPAFLPAITSYQAWAGTLVKHAHSSEVGRSKEYWLQVLDTPGRVPVDFSRGPNTRDSARRLFTTFDRETTRLLVERRTAGSESWLGSALLATAGRVLREWTGKNEIRMDVEGHGRQDIAPHVDVGRTVGWFTALYPMRIQAVSGNWIELAVPRTAEEISRLPGQGISYGLLRYLGPDEDLRRRFAEAGDSDVCFNYLGQFDHLWSSGALFRALQAGSEGDRNAERPYLLQIEAVVTAGELRVDWEYSENLHRPETIRSLVDSFRRILLELCKSSSFPKGEAGMSNPALARLGQNQLEQVIAALESAGER